MRSMTSKLLWQPNQQTIYHSHMIHFMRAVNNQYHFNFKKYDELYQWSIDQPEQFWKIMAEFSKIKFSEQPTKIIQYEKEMWKTKWFVDATLNFAENLLARRDDHVALIYANENGEREKITYRELYLSVTALAEKLTLLGLKSGDRVAGLVTNRIETVIAMLATTSLGAIWTACGPEFGVEALVERFSQIEPKILFVINEHNFGGKKFNHSE